MGWWNGSRWRPRVQAPIPQNQYTEISSISIYQ
jgi:hypothetical protein